MLSTITYVTVDNIKVFFNRRSRWRRFVVSGVVRNSSITGRWSVTTARSSSTTGAWLRNSHFARTTTTMMMELDMKFLVQNGGVYFPVGNHEYVCIGSVAEVQGSSREKVIDMVLEAVAIAKFNELDSKGVKH